ncbi:hypothetical protein Q7C_812 [Methylophaga frappieri]|uniref:Uncharacterized protein n=2 Tax=Methylophaga frappieri (strain ATCC BAA-2434 / DSM 25690 / JAM7) TaxID=754477 RepID=I1YGD8_METFJ|nr:hypothetical protein Q7C_812 [Methylophaga frappieri]
MASITARTKFIRDRVMFYITDSADKTKFGMSAMVSLFDGKASEEEVSEAVDWLIKNQHLKMLGKYVFGVGTYEGIKRYDVSDHDPNSLIPDLNDNPGESSHEDTSPDCGKERPNCFDKQEQKPQQQLHIDNIPTLFGLSSDEKEEGVFAAIDRLKKQLKPERVPNVAMKLAVLSELASVLEPDISLVLREIQADYRKHAID